MAQTIGSKNLVESFSEESFTNWPHTQSHLIHLFVEVPNTISQSELNEIFDKNLLHEIAEIAENNTSVTKCDDITVDEDSEDKVLLCYKFTDQNEAEISERDIQKKLKENKLLMAKSVHLRIKYDSASHPGNVYVRGLSPSTTQSELTNLLKKYGEIISCKIVYDQYGQNKVYAFVNFSTSLGARNAIKALNGKEYKKGHQLYLNHHISKQERMNRLKMEKINFKNLYIKNIPSHKTEEEILKLFEQFGEIDSYFLPKVNDDSDPEYETHEQNSSFAKRRPGSSASSDHPLKGYGFIKFKSHDDALHAMEKLKGFRLDDHVLTISRAQRREERNMEEQSQRQSQQHHRIQQQQSSVQMQRVQSAGSLDSTAGPQPFYNGYTLPMPPASSSSSMASDFGFQSYISPYCLWVSNLSAETKKSDLLDLFSPFGKVSDIRINATNEGTAALVKFESPAVITNASIGTNQKIVNGNKIFVSFASKDETGPIQMPINPYPAAAGYGMGMYNMNMNMNMNVPMPMGMMYPPAAAAAAAAAAYYANFNNYRTMTSPFYPSTTVTENNASSPETDEQSQYSEDAAKKLSNSYYTNYHGNLDNAKSEKV